MSTSIIQVGGSNVTLVAMPTSPGLRAVEFKMEDGVAEVASVFTGQIQTQEWPGAEKWTGTLTLPPLQRADAANWIAFLLQLRGIANAFQVGDPMWTAPLGQPLGSQPVANNGLNSGNPAMSKMLGTSGWTPSTTGLLLPGDYIQVDYRLYRVLDSVDSDQSGAAVISIWPSLREVPTNATSIITGANDGPQPKGLFRLATNQRGFSFDITQLTHLSIPIMEWR
jgi:hypothetical protein